jgi:hypothetical protein
MQTGPSSYVQQKIAQILHLYAKTIQIAFANQNMILIAILKVYPF